jgi:PPM family protein phosphatase
MRSDVGAVRSRNEDAAYVDPGARFFAVADGMGGHAGGDVASATAVDVVRTILDAGAAEIDRLATAPDADRRRRVRGLLERAVQYANEIVLERARERRELQGMGTTLEVVVVAGHELFIAHVGDSRTYLVRDGYAARLTVDHTVAESMRSNGLWSDDEARSSPMRSVLTNAIGLKPMVAIDQRHLPLHDGDRLLLCSDGLYDYFSIGELGVAMQQTRIDDGLAALIAAARARGGHDNITGVAIELPGPRHERGVPVEGLAVGSGSIPIARGA